MKKGGGLFYVYQPKAMLLGLVTHLERRGESPFLLSLIKVKA
jgi:hypothetical protein